MNKTPFSRIAFFASHGGSSMQAIAEACRSGRLAAQAVLLITNNSEAPALQKAKALGMPTRHISSSSAGSAEAAEQQILEALEFSKADLLVLSGYMRPLSSKIVGRYSGRILNIHPSLLPKFGGHGMYGMHVHRAVIAAQERESGISIHTVDEQYDTGPVVAQCHIPVVSEDSAESLAERVRMREPTFFVETLQAILQGTIQWPAGASNVLQTSAPND